MMLHFYILYTYVAGPRIYQGARDFQETADFNTMGQAYHIRHQDCCMVVQQHVQSWNVLPGKHVDPYTH